MHQVREECIGLVEILVKTLRLIKSSLNRMGPMLIGRLAALILTKFNFLNTFFDVSFGVT